MPSAIGLEVAELAEGEVRIEAASADRIARRISVGVRRVPMFPAETHRSLPTFSVPIDLLAIRDGWVVWHHRIDRTSIGHRERVPIGRVWGVIGLPTHVPTFRIWGEVPYQGEIVLVESTGRVCRNFQVRIGLKGPIGEDKIVPTFRAATGQICRIAQVRIARILPSVDRAKVGVDQAGHPQAMSGISLASAGLSIGRVIDQIGRG